MKAKHKILGNFSVKKCCRMGKDLLSILGNLGIVDFSHVIPFIGAKYFRSVGCTKKQKSLHFFEVNYLLFKQNFIFETLLEYWKRKRCFSDISKFIGLTEPNFKNKNILDVGCGYTSILNLLPESNRYGIDIVVSSLNRNHFHLNGNIKWMDGYAANLPFKSDFFDIVFCSNALDHFEDPCKAIHEIKRVLKDNGLFILIVDVFGKGIGHRDIQHPHSFLKKTILSELKYFEILFQKYGSNRKISFSKFVRNKIKIGMKRRNNENVIPHERRRKELILVLQVK